MSLFGNQLSLFSSPFPRGIADCPLCYLTFTPHGRPLDRSAFSIIHGNEPAARSGLLTSHH
jgi:hypothetical protein